MAQCCSDGRFALGAAKTHHFPEHNPEAVHVHCKHALDGLELGLRGSTMRKMRGVHNTQPRQQRCHCRRQSRKRKRSQ